MKNFNPYQQIGYDITLGISFAISKLLIILVIFIFLFNLFNLGTDNTDHSGFKRSNLQLHTDALTGLQYLSTKNGALIPRLNKNGKHISIDIKP